MPPLIRTTLAPVTLAPEASVTTPRMEAAGADRDGGGEQKQMRRHVAMRAAIHGEAQEDCAETGMMAPSFPSERKRVEGARTGLLTCASSSHLPTDAPRGTPAVVHLGLSAMGGRTLAGFLPWPDRTGRWAGALTVAGQWRSFTAFPSILAIAVVGCAAPLGSSRYGMEQISMPSTFIDEAGEKSKSGAISNGAGSEGE